MSILYGKGVVLCNPSTGAKNPESYWNRIIPVVMKSQYAVKALSANGFLRIKILASPNSIENVIRAIRKK